MRLVSVLVSFCFAGCTSLDYQSTNEYICPYIVDSGPIEYRVVSAQSRDDAEYAHHFWCMQEAEALPGIRISCGTCYDE